MLSERFDQALAYASALHREQTRKGKETPYVAHLLATASIAIENGADEDEAIAALLHDAIEDQGGEATRREIERRFGSRVAAIVVECSDTDETPKPPWRARKEAYLAHLAELSPSARLVATCDKLHNARTLLLDYEHHGEAVWDRFNGGRDGTLWYYRAIADALATGNPSPVATELLRTVAQLEALVKAAADRIHR